MAREPIGPYSYPLVDQDRYKAKIMFQALRVEPPQFSNDIRFAVSETAEAVTNFSLERTDEEKEQILGSIRSQAAKEKNLKKMRVLTIDGERANIYLPVSLTFDDRLNYQQPSLDTMGATLLAGINQGSGLFASAANAIEQGFASITDFARSLPSEAAALAAVRASQSFAGRILPESVRNAISIAARVTLNPNTVAAFGSVGLRTFSFQFKFIPKSREEAEEVKKIIYFFRKHAYPEVITTGNIPIGYKFPDMFRIRVMYAIDGIQSVFKPIGSGILDSYLQSITTNYNPTTMSYHPDGEPLEIDMTLNFIEHRTLTRRDIKLEPDLIQNPDYQPEPNGPF